MVRAITGAFCTTCGDNVTEAPLEQCDDGPGNSYAPNSCRPGCQLPSCGDGVVDTLTEGCDDGALNAADGACGLDCQTRLLDCTENFDSPNWDGGLLQQTTTGVWDTSADGTTSSTDTGPTSAHSGTGFIFTEASSHTNEDFVLDFVPYFPAGVNAHIELWCVHACVAFLT